MVEFAHIPCSTDLSDSLDGPVQRVYPVSREEVLEELRQVVHAAGAGSMDVIVRRKRAIPPGPSLVRGIAAGEPTEQPKPGDLSDEHNSKRERPDDPDIMTVGDEMMTDALARYLTEREISGAPVVDSQGHLIAWGSISMSPRT